MCKQNQFSNSFPLYKKKSKKNRIMFEDLQKYDGILTKMGGM